MTIHESVLNYIKEYFIKHCYAPTIDEISSGIYLSKTATNRHVEMLFDEGELVTDLDDRKGSARSYRPKGFKCVDGENEYRFRWHDLRLNPDDLPEEEQTKYLIWSRKSYGVETATGWWIKNYALYNDVIAWKEIEPFSLN